MGANDISVPWSRFIEAWRADDDDESLAWIRVFIHVWDEAFWANDFESFARVYTDDVEISNRTRAPTFIVGNSRRGVAGFEQLREDMVEVARFFRFDIEEVRRASGDRVVAIGKSRIRSRYAGLVIRTSFAVVWTLRGDRICSAVGYTSPRRALRDAGIGSAGPAYDDSGLVTDVAGDRDLGD